MMQDVLPHVYLLRCEHEDGEMLTDEEREQILRGSEFVVHAETCGMPRIRVCKVGLSRHTI
jgi:hypothetical protein